MISNGLFGPKTRAASRSARRRTRLERSMIVAAAARVGSRRRRARVCRRGSLRAACVARCAARSDCDFLGCSAYKFYGPHVGSSLRKRVARRDRFPEASPRAITRLRRTRRRARRTRKESWVPRPRWTSSPRYRDRERRDVSVSQATFDELHARGSFLSRQLWEWPIAIDGVRLYGPPPGYRPHPNGGVHCGRNSFERSRAEPGRAWRLLLTRRLLCDDGSRTTRLI